MAAARSAAFDQNRTGETLTETELPFDKIKASGGRRILSIVECMVELADQGGRTFRQGFAGDTFNTAWYCRALPCAPRRCRTGRL